MIIFMSKAHKELTHWKGPFWQDNALFASKHKINVFLKKIQVESPKGGRTKGETP